MTRYVSSSESYAIVSLHLSGLTSIRIAKKIGRRQCTVEKHLKIKGYTPYRKIGPYSKKKKAIRHTEINGSINRAHMDRREREARIEKIVWEEKGTGDPYYDNIL